ncbi:STAS domain-containing protein [Leptothrix discophora]|uniref:STAS domain-containing protein n=1 Tax=Leptothrix discophora TaxID=89 RepID=A0ABT9G0H0_LEPDI|nr:STAS domain-containing protein [Leptothrix discophora]MDP4299977.1 STAS domain-containing protein [Leptothrix discophora]
MNDAVATDTALAATPAVSCTLPAELTIFTAAETRDRLLALLARAEAEDLPLHVDASEVLDVDGAGVQLLVSLSRQCERDRRFLRLLSPADALVRACQVLGLSFWLSAQTPSADTA